eukprot:767139-Hanusia_phi.AAC.1
MSTLSAISLGSSWETKEVENLVAFVDESSPTRQVMSHRPLTKRPHKVLLSVRLDLMKSARAMRGAALSPHLLGVSGESRNNQGLTA